LQHIETIEHNGSVIRAKAVATDGTDISALGRFRAHPRGFQQGCAVAYIETKVNHCHRWGFEG